MTNEMLAILLKKYKNRLSKAITEVEKELPQNLQEEIKPIFGPKYKYFPQLESLRALEDDLSSDIQLLIQGMVEICGTGNGEV